jgi:hypothetical protein
MARRTAKGLAGLGVVLLACATIVGCGSGLAEVSGVVTLDGQPLRGGSGDTRVTVQFEPSSGVGSTSIGLADENGAYTLGTGAKTGIPPGEYLVSCSASQLVMSRDGKSTAGARRITDPKYANAKTSGLKFVVEPGSNEFNIPLVSPSGRQAGGRSL